MGFGLLVIVLVAVTGGSAWQMQVHRSNMADMERHAATSSLLQDARHNATLANLLLERYVITENDAVVPLIRSSATATVDSLTEAIAQEELRRTEDEEELGTLDEAAAGAALFAQSAEQVIALRRSGDAQGAAATLAETVPIITQFQQVLTEATEHEAEEVAELQAEAGRTSDLAFWFTAVAGAIGAAFGLAASAFIARSILKPLSSLESAALAVAAGDLKARAQAKGPRELAHLGASLNRMTESLLDASKRRELEKERDRAFAHLRESESRYRALVDTITHGIEEIDSSGVITFANAAHHRQYEYSEGELIGMSIFDIAPTDSEADELREYLKYLLEEQPSPTPFVGHKRTKSGKIIDVEVAWTYTRDAEERVTGFASIITDVTERKKAEEAVVEMASFAEMNPAPVLRLDEQGVIQIANAATQTLFRDQHLSGKSWHSLVLELERDAIQRLLHGRDILQHEAQIGDRRFLFTYLGIPERGHAHVYGADISERKRAEETLRLTNEELQERNRQLLDARTEAATDGLTGLGNHRAFQERIRDEVSQAQENGNIVGLIMLDIDGFKQINDSRGHIAGDQILRELVTTLAGLAKRKDTYRFGGDEFALLLPGADGNKAARVAERLRRAVAKRTDDNGAKATVSLGIADFPHTADSADQLIYGADAAMYWAKSAGKNRVGDWANLFKHHTDGTLPWYAADRGVGTPDVVATLVAALAAKDPITSAHTERCSWYTTKLAEELGFGEEETLIVRLASLLHDIGKLAVPDDILCKPGPLNEEEWTQMKQHPAAALHVLAQIRSIADATPAIHHHHEHFDGSGYPDGLAGDDIPLASRILLVTDAFDAMTTDRPYRKAMPVEAAIEELKRNSGGQFDPVIVEAFLRILARHGAQPLRSARSDATKTAATVRTA